MSRLFLFFVRRSWAANIICEGESVDSILASDKIILAAPIYSWSCPAPMKALLDRLVYGMNKYYGDEKGPTYLKRV